MGFHHRSKWFLAVLIHSFSLNALDLDLTLTPISAKTIQGKLSPGAPIPNLLVEPALGSLIESDQNCTKANAVCALQLPLDTPTPRTVVEIDMAKPIPNLKGIDFYVFQKAEINRPEAFALSVYDEKSGKLSRYRYEFATTYTKALGIAGFAFGFDLSKFEIPEGESIQLIRISNLFGHDSGEFADQVDTPTGQGFVLFSGTSEKGFPFVGGPLAKENQSFTKKHLTPRILTVVGVLRS